MNSGSLAIEIQTSLNGERQAAVDRVAVEEPLEIRLGFSTPDGRATRSIAITMRTPGNDKDLATGFLFTESIVHALDDITSVEVCGSPDPDTGLHNVIRVELAADVEVDLGRLQRHFYTSSSCGVCGKASLEALHVVGLTAIPDNDTYFSARKLAQVPANLRAAQTTFDDTGGLHAAGAFRPDGTLIACMEDVGRHNAVDKLIGRLLAESRLPAHELGIMVSGRASFELMQKSLVAGMPLLAAVGAPSSLAVKLAREFNMTLVGFLRGDGFNIYAGEHRLCA
ncbi:MAG TPA: formate dehydrogenase accessory sulfurtransferase FdhD [Woeseiaceae bacterium]|nr:formate dehydrogenase accessory sulfurtransferase FdhD [Woeseiaceae bacterium]